jgi:hypothetical protein
MKIADIIYFSPKYKLLSIKWDDRNLLLKAFKDRIDSYYIQPAKYLDKNKHGFSTTLICVSLIDSLARLATGERNRSKKRFIPFVEKLFKINNELAMGLYSLRCGLVHETYAKNAYIDYRLGPIVCSENSILGINPHKLLQKIEEIFNNYLKALEKDDKLFMIFKENLQEDFDKELKLLKQGMC